MTIENPLLEPDKPYKKYLLIGISSLLILCLGIGLFAFSKTHRSKAKKTETATTSHSPTASVTVPHIRTPNPVKAIYITSWVAGIPKWRNTLVDLIDTTEINAVIIDVKDYSGLISFQTDNPRFQNSQEIRIRDLKEFIDYLHSKHIYTIARITVFQDPTFAKQFPQYAVQSKSTGKVWKDRNGLAYIDPAAQPFWDYISELATTCVGVGFDEINFDYIRFPTDGNMKDMNFPISGPMMAKMGPGKPIPVNTVSGNRSVSGNTKWCIIPTANLNPKARVLQTFYQALHHRSKSWGVPISADLFGMVLTAQDDLNIGQVLEVAAPCFDYICPMIYPSHYPPGFKGFSNPAAHPYEIINFVMNCGISRMKRMGQPTQKLRPWLQDFNLGAVYDAQKVSAQHKALYAAGLHSWLMWDPRNKYTRGAYKSDKPVVSSSNTLVQATKK